MVGAQYPLAGLLPKFMFLNALTYVQQGDAEGFKEALKALIEKYPKADVSEPAGEMLKGVLRGREMVQGDVRGMTWNLRFGLGADGSLSASDSARTFTADPNRPCRIVLMYPAGRVDDNQLLYAVAAYNFANFLVKEFDFAFAEAAPLRTLSVSGFIHFDEALQYYRMIYGKDGYASSLNREVAVVPISDENYTTLMRGKTLEEYVLFLEEHFASEAAELIARLRARLDVALIEEAPLPEAEEAPLPEAEEIISPEAEEAPLPEAEAEETPPLPVDSAAVDSAAPPARQETLQPAAEPQKTPAQLRKEKEREYKQRQQLKAKERKEKERAYKQKLKERRKAQKRSSGKNG